MKVAITLLKAGFWVAVLSIPLLGVWLATSLAAYGNGPTLVALLVGALCFPVLPVAWEGFAEWRRKRARTSGGSFLQDLDSRRRNERISTLGDRLLLRTLAINLVFAATLLMGFPQTAFDALTARGDWFLDGIDQPWADAARLRILRVADRAEWLADLQEPNPYADMGEVPDTTAPEPEPTGPERVAISVDIPEGVVAQIGEELPPVRLDAPGSVELIPEIETAVRLFSADGRKDVCSYTPSSGGSVGFEQIDEVLYVREGPSRRACVRLQQADPDWEPELHLIDYWGKPLGPKIAADGIERVKIREPYYRVELTDAASDELCTITRDNPRMPLALVVEGEQRFRTERDAMTQCTGAVSFPMFDLPEGVDPPAERPDPHGNWPMPDEVHPLIRDLPDEHATSIALVGKYVAANEPDPWQRVKALHDFVVTRIDYDESSLEDGRRAPQDADTVFRTGTGVCAGYANLLVALGRASGDEIVYLTGDARQKLGDIGGAPHAWNAAKIEDQWVLIDATWDVGDTYSTDWLFTPPEVFRLSHIPSDEGWQLAEPVSAGEINRAPMLQPAFFAADLGLADPDRAQVAVSGDARLRITNPRGADVAVAYEVGGARERCTVVGSDSITATCAFPGPGTYDVLVFHRFGTSDDYDFGGKIQYVW